MNTQEQKIDNPWRDSIENILTGDNYFRAGEWRELLADLDRLYAIEAAVEQADRDAQRLDWLSLQDLNDTCFAFIHDAPHDGEIAINVGYGAYYGKTLREAIDAAMNQPKKGDKP